MQENMTAPDDYSILVEASQAEKQNRVLKHGETFAVFDRQGSFLPGGRGDHGLYHEGTRFLSRFQLRLAGRKPLVLSSAVREDNDMLEVDSANPDLEIGGRVIKGDRIHIYQTCFLWNGCLYMRLRFTNYALEPIDLPFTLEFASDFADIFEVRGMHRPARGRQLAPQLGRDVVVIGYLGLDGLDRNAQLRFDPAPAELGPAYALYSLSLPSHGRKEFYFTATCESGPRAPRTLAYQEAFTGLGEAFRCLRGSTSLLESSHPQFDSWINRSTVDLFMMTTETREGGYPYAGIPWFSTVFGRDGILTAYQLSWACPGLAAGVLRFLAARQARESDPSRDAEPGKILHETRNGEMANLGEIPFGRYYGGIDTTPLFLMLAARYHARTGDLPLLRELWPHFEAALDWIDRYGDADRDGFVEYQRAGKAGLLQQGWKDSEDSVFHYDGSLAPQPIALCEVQGYVYAAKRGMARLARALGKPGLADRLDVEASDLKTRFRAAFWLPDLGTYALALDGNKRPCQVRSSNAGHCLFAGIADEADAPALVNGLLSPAMFSGWGIRTLAEGEARYNPMSYHNGSVWPHDNALIAWGMGRYGFRAAACQVLEGLFQASLHFDLHRLPELFCGFVKRPGAGPTLYPVACNPQSWASASVYFLLEACLGLEIDAVAGQVRLTQPRLPAFLDEIRIRELKVGDAILDLTVRRHGNDITVEMPRRVGKIEVVESLGAPLYEAARQDGL
ncbi:MAG: amylo-alpha-1,6-glucosidase [Fibrobacteres bacterium]|nr:amylo-alpha-1,6-glucosidase [Fibrobacterota bacterium]